MELHFAEFIDSGAHAITFAQVLCCIPRTRLVVATSSLL